MNIKKIRVKALLTQREFAKAIGTSYSAVTKWEQGLTQPTFKTQRKIIEFCKENKIDIGE